MRRNILFQPYPFNPSKKRAVFNALTFGLFIFLFLALFQPFGLTNYRSETKILELAGYGLVTSSLLVFNTFIFSLAFPSWFSEKNWTVGKNILFTLWVLFMIGLGNLMYSNALHYVHLGFNAFVFYQGVTVLVGLIPITISTLFVYNKNLSKSIRTANELNKNYPSESNNADESIELPSRNKSEKVELSLNDLLALKAIENYVEIYFSEESQLQKRVIRNTLKEIEVHLKSQPSIQKCHRSYLVNTQQIQSVTGNAQGLKLLLYPDPILEIPVSRSFVDKLKKLAKHKS